MASKPRIRPGISPNGTPSTVTVETKLGAQLPDVSVDQCVIEVVVVEITRVTATE